MKPEVSRSSHIFEAVERVLSSNEEDLKTLARIAGYDYRSFYIGQDLSLCDLSGQDLRGMDLTRAKISVEGLDDKTLLDPIFDPRIDLNKQKRYLAIPYPILWVAEVYRTRRNFTRLGDAIKELIDISYVSYSLIGRRAWQDIIDDNKNMFAAMFATHGYQRKRFDLILKDVSYGQLHRFGKKFPGRSPGIVVGLIMALQYLGIVRVKDNRIDIPETRQWISVHQSKLQMFRKNMRQGTFSASDGEEEAEQLASLNVDISNDDDFLRLRL